MSKTGLIIQREYITRVRKKSFLITTLLFPLLYLGMTFGTSYITEKSQTKLNIALTDASGKFTAERVANANQAFPNNTLTLVTTDSAETAKTFVDKGFDGYVFIPAQASVGTQNNWSVYTKRTLGTASDIEYKLNSIWSDVKYQELGIDADKKAQLSNKIVLKARNVDNNDANGSVAIVIGYVSGVLIYLILLIYGSQVMMGVMEEKTNRIAEIMVSSVKPFQLMLGKIIGIALVALTQFFLWVLFMVIIYNATKSGAGESSSINQMLSGIQAVLNSVDIPLVLGCFVFYFLGGFFFYSALYAAIGSAVNEDMREAQSLSFPITLLIIFSIVIMPSAIKDPTGPVAFWGSIIPFTSPIVMMGRIPYGVPDTVPYWQLGLSMLLLVVTFIAITWFAGKIYRTGILMYGKKPSWKEMMKWAFKK